RTLPVLRRNLTALGLAERSTIVERDVFALLDEDEGAIPFDLALADPPYASDAAARLLERFAARPFARLLCIEAGAEKAPPPTAVWTRRYGDTRLTFYSDESVVESGS
ncbi:MAG: 16S rRNA (guanine(966)-N(2))-methyltransferase RsmD, partial [Gemmatimonadota bacterium]